MAATLRAARRRIGYGAAALAVASAGTIVIVVATTPESATTLSVRRAAASESVLPVPAAIARAVVPAADAGLTAAAWDVEHPPPPPPLPVPAALPNPSAPRDLVEIGRIQIPKTGVDEAIREGVEQVVIDHGPAHWPGTAEIGGWGNLVLAGHRSIHTAPFRRNGELVAGDAIVLSDTTGTYRYSVTSVEVVAPTALWIVDQHPGRTLTIFTCHPIGSSAQRLVVRAELVSRPRPGD
ncbi:MAG: class E sortase [Acidimicrobiia bacterium]|nr:class E sortase [Acidimicrobiia bacterium]